LPHTEVVTSVDDLEHHVASLAPDAPWVAKAPWSAAGRDRILRRGALDPPMRTRARRLLARFGALLVEPWLRRTADAGCSGLITAGGPILLAVHRLDCDDKGIFRGIVPFEPAAALSGDERELLLDTTREVAGALAGFGYRGPFGIDAYRYIDPAGRSRFHPLSEINARLTFGLVARALVHRIGLAQATRLVVGSPLPNTSHVPLLAPAPDEPTAAYLEPA